MSSKTECSICCETKAKVISCTTCDFVGCLDCNKQYLLSKEKDDPHCMSCKNLWDWEFLADHFKRSTMVEFKENKKHVLFQQEQARMPDTQVMLQFDKYVDRCEARVSEARKRMEDLECIKYESMCDKERYTRQQISAVYRELGNLQMETRETQRTVSAWRWDFSIYVGPAHHYTVPLPEDLRALVRAEQHGGTHHRGAGAGAGASRAPKYVFACPEDTCKGFVMDSDWKCGVCRKEFCRQCHQEKEHEGENEGENEAEPEVEASDGGVLREEPVALARRSHTCKPEDVETAKVIMASSRACPTCATRIQKISGCNQMWCTSCNTGFDYRTGEVETGAIHNPHYFEWLQKQQAAGGGGGGGGGQYGAHNFCDQGIPPINRLMSNLTFHASTRMYGEIMAIYRLAQHLLNHESRYRFRSSGRQTRRPNLDLRLKWLKNETDDKTFRKMLHKRHKQVIVNRRRLQVYEMFTTVAGDVFRRLTRRNNAYILQELHELVRYTNTCFHRLCRVYGVMMPVINLVAPRDGRPVYQVTFETYQNSGYLPMRMYPKEIEQF